MFLMNIIIIRVSYSNIMKCILETRLFIVGKSVYYQYEIILAYKDKFGNLPYVLRLVGICPRVDRGNARLGSSISEPRSGRKSGYLVGAFLTGTYFICAARIKNRSIRSCCQTSAETEEAKEETARTNAMTFATTVEGKWGEYDADSLEKIKNARQEKTRPASTSDSITPTKLRPPEDR